MPDAARRALARQAMNEGRMPRRMPPEPSTSGPGSGRACAICGEAIRTTDVEFEVRAQDACYNVESFFVHERCEAEWRHALGEGEPRT